MADRYFDPDRSTDLAFLPVESHDATDLDLFASEAEADTIQYYTRDISTVNPLRWTSIRGPMTMSTVYTALGDNLGVFLRFYTVDPALVDTSAADGAAFLTAMKRTIAALISWRIMQSKMNLTAIQETRGGRHMIKAPLQIEPYPPNWTRWLDPFSTLPPVYSL